MATIKITGANGFIGKKLMQVFDAESIDRVELYDDFGLLEEKLEGAETVIHLAAYGNHSWQNIEKEIFEANVESTFRILEACKKTEVKNFINIGSSSEYGHQLSEMTENMMPGAFSMYGCTKVAGTYLTRHYSEYFNTVTIRPFSVYGEEEDDRRFIPTIIRSIVQNETLNLSYGMHDWIYIDDFVRAIAVIIKNINKLNGSIINVGAGFQTENSEIVKILEEISGKKVNINEVEQKKGQSSVWFANIETMNQLGWQPSYLLEEGLKNVYDFKRKSYQNQ